MSHPFAADLKRTFRNLLATPSFTLPVLLVLALGIGATTAVFGALRTILLAAPPYPDAERVVNIQRSIKGSSGNMPASWPEYLDYRDRLTTLEAVAGVSYASMNLTGVDAPVQVAVGQFTPAFFHVFQVKPLLGTLPMGDGATPGAVLSETFWRKNLGGTPPRSAGASSSTARATRSWASCRPGSTWATVRSTSR
jgi:hypothetical protein